MWQKLGTVKMYLLVVFSLVVFVSVVELVQLTREQGRLNSFSYVEEIMGTRVLFNEEHRRLLPYTEFAIDYVMTEAERVGIVTDQEKTLLLKDESSFHALSNETMRVEHGLSAFYNPSNDQAVVGVDFSTKEGEELYFFNSETERQDSLFANSFMGMVAHEVGHSLLANYLWDNGLQFNDLPIWFHEGVAEYLSRGFSLREIRRSPKFEFIDFRQLHQIQDFKSYYRDGTANPYLQSFIAVNKLVKIAGDEGIIEVVEKVGAGEDFYLALEQVMNMNLGELEKFITLEFERYNSLFSIL